MLRGILLAATLTLAGCATAGPTPDAAAAAPAAPPATYAGIDAPSGTYALDGRHVSVSWGVRHLGLAKYIARFDTVSGTLALDAAQPTNSALKAEIDVNSVSTGLLDKNGARKFDAEVAEALGAKAHPKITFTSTALTRTGPETGVMTGDLTLNGVTKPVTLTVGFYGATTHPMLQKKALGFSAKTVLKRSDFGVTKWDMFVADDVEVNVEVEFLQQ